MSEGRQRFRVEQSFEASCQQALDGPSQDAVRVALPRGLVLELEGGAEIGAAAGHAVPVSERAWREVFCPGSRGFRRLLPPC